MFSVGDKVKVTEQAQGAMLANLDGVILTVYSVEDKDHIYATDKREINFVFSEDELEKVNV